MKTDPEKLGLARIPLICAWRGCANTCEGMPEPLPEGWTCLVTFRSVTTPGVLDFGTDIVRRDAVLCAYHHQKLEERLKRID